MSFLKRAWYAITRKKAKSVILLVIFVAIANLVITGISIQNASIEAEKSAREKLGGEITLSFDFQKMMEEQMTKNAEQNSGQGNRGQGGRGIMVGVTQEPVTEEMALAIAQSEHVRDFNYIVNTTAFANGFEPVTDEEESEDTSSGFTISGNNGSRNQIQISMPDLTIIGLSASSLEANFSGGTYKITEGQGITQNLDMENPVLIEKQLADLNELKVGDVINITATEDGEVITLNIVGIYDSGPMDTSNMFRGMSLTLPYNKIYIDYKDAIKIKELATKEAETDTDTEKEGPALTSNNTIAMVRIGSSTSSPGIDSVVFFADEATNIDKIIEYARTTDVDLEKFKLDANDEEYQKMVGPIRNVASFSKMLVIIVTFAGALILALILMLWIKDRMYETGVLLSLGEAKGKIVMQYVIEVVIIAFIAFALSTVTSNFVSQKVGNILLNQQIEEIEKEENENNNNNRNRGQMVTMVGSSTVGSMNNVRDVEVEKEINVSLTPKVVLQLYGIGLAIILFATIAPTVLVFRYNPKKILTNAG